jgi:hypothetical protein
MISLTPSTKSSQTFIPRSGLCQEASRRFSNLGPVKSYQTFRQTHQHLQMLIQHHLSSAVLCDRLEDLPHQFKTPQSRPWQPIYWKSISAAQIIGIDPLIFIAVLAGCADTEDPIRDYSQTSRQYLAPLHPEMAQLVGGATDDRGNSLTLGLWEKEERRHSPALQKLYTQLTGLKLRLLPHKARPYRSMGNPELDLYHHGLHRIATEYSAACLYLWLAAHAAGPLRMVLEELLVDEINHMTKFWGYGLWAYPKTSWPKVVQTLAAKAVEKLWHRESGSFLHTLRRMAQVLHWDAWSFSNKATFLWTFGLTLRQMHCWSRSLSPEYLETLLGQAPQSSFRGPQEMPSPPSPLP